MPKKYGARWETLESLGEGGQAHTFVVRDVQVEGTVRYALKRLKNTNRLERFRTEVDILRSLSHPNVIKLVDFDLENDPPYFVSELCEGGDLTNYRSTYKDNAPKALITFIEICKGVAAAHEADVIHRDIKPANILFRTDEGPVVVADFGIAYVEDGERQTLTDEAVGPRNFIAPELEDGQAET